MSDDSLDTWLRHAPLAAAISRASAVGSSPLICFQCSEKGLGFLAFRWDSYDVARRHGSHFSRPFLVLF